MTHQNAHALEMHQRLYDSHCDFLEGLRELLTEAAPGSGHEAGVPAAIAAAEQAADASYAEIERLSALAMAALIEGSALPCN